MSNRDNVMAFTADLKAFSRLKDIALATVCKGTVLRLFNAIVEDTPVDTGRARSSWAFSVGEASDFHPPELSAEQQKLKDEAKDKGESGPEFFSKPDPPDVSGVDGTQRLFIVSNLVYIEPLENGHSQQRPAGMVLVNVVALEASMEQEIASLIQAGGGLPGGNNP